IHDVYGFHHHGGERKRHSYQTPVENGYGYATYRRGGTTTSTRTRDEEDAPGPGGPVTPLALRDEEREEDDGNPAISAWISWKQLYDEIMTEIAGTSIFGSAGREGGGIREVDTRPGERAAAIETRASSPSSIMQGSAKTVSGRVQEKEELLGTETTSRMADLDVSSTVPSVRVAFEKAAAFHRTDSKEATAIAVELQNLFQHDWHGFQYHLDSSYLGGGTGTYLNKCDAKYRTRELDLTMSRVTSEGLLF
ncbi:unnamed protein product, partial [Amoebophrya sp. A25]